MPSINAIKRRKKSVQSTQKITKAMKLVSTVKLQKAKKVAEESHIYFKEMYKTINSLLSRMEKIDHPFVSGVDNENAKKCVIVISSNRGLAGGYNANIVKLIDKDKFPLDKTQIVALGSKAKDVLHSKGYEIIKENQDLIEKPDYSEIKKLCDEILDLYLHEEISELYVAYTEFKNTVTHVPKLLKILPIDRTQNNEQNFDSSEQDASLLKEENQKKSDVIMNFEQEEEEALSLLIPKYVGSMLYGGVIEAIASENGARMQAMDSATSNAEDIIAHLTLTYNRVRQGAITQELTEIIAGADAV